MIGTELLAVSPLDGRYASKLRPLGEIFSEYGLIARRLIGEVRLLSCLANEPGLAELPALSPEAQEHLENVLARFSPQEAWR